MITCSVPSPPTRGRVLQFDGAEYPGNRLEVIGTHSHSRYNDTGTHPPLKTNQFKMKVKFFFFFRKRKTVKMRMRKTNRRTKMWQNPTYKSTLGLLSPQPGKRLNYGYHSAMHRLLLPGPDGIVFTYFYDPLSLKMFFFNSSEQKAVGKIIKFGTNIDLSDPKRWEKFTLISLVH